MRTTLLPVTAAILAISLLVGPTLGYAGAQEDIDRDLAQIKQQEAAIAQKKSEADKQKADLKVQKGQEMQKLDDIRQTLDQQGEKLNELSKQVDDVTLSLKEAGDDLQQAETRVADREKMLKSRVQLMYLNGNVSYLDVIFSATSFSDFLDRIYTLKTIIGQDKSVLEANKMDRDLVAQKKQQIETQLEQVRTLVAQAEDLKQQLLVQEKQKQVVIASLNSKEQAEDDVSEEATQEIIALANQKREVLRRQAELDAKNSGKAPQPAFAYSGGKLAWPVPSSSRISDVFGMRIDPIKKVRKLHAGIDIAAPNGSTIVAAEDGTVILASWVRGYGNTVMIDHGNGVVTLYGHIRDNGIKVKEGQTVKRGEKIAEVGSTGDSTGNHCHFEVHVNDKPTDPMPFLK